MEKFSCSIFSDLRNKRTLLKSWKKSSNIGFLEKVWKFFDLLKHLLHKSRAVLKIKNVKVPFALLTKPKSQQKFFCWGREASFWRKIWPNGLSSLSIWLESSFWWVARGHSPTNPALNIGLHKSKKKVR